MTLYALTTDGLTVTTTATLPPTGARRLDTGQWVTPPDGVWTDSLLAACGWLEVAETPRPADTDTHTHDYAVELLDGTPTEVWTVREWTADELEERSEQTVETTLTDQVRTEIQAIRDAIGPGDAPPGTESLNAIINSTNASINANPAQYLKPTLRIVRSIARAVIRIARVAVRDYSTPATD